MTTISTDHTTDTTAGTRETEPQPAEPQDADAARPPAAENNQVSMFTQRPMIPVSLLTAHPGNVREDKQASPEFCQSVAAAGILVPLEITTSPGTDGYLVVDGNIRLDAAIRTGLDAVPYVFSPDTADDAGLQYLHMLISSRFRRDLSTYEEAAALFSAAEAGMTRTQIRKATGLKAAEVRDGISAGSLSPKAREMAEQAGYEWDLEELALLRPFEDDAEAMEQIMHGISYGSSVRYLVQRITDERDAAARRQQLAATLQAAGHTVVDQPPAGAVSLRLLLARTEPGDEPGRNPGNDAAAPGSAGDPDDDSADAPGIDPGEHAACPGAAVYLSPYREEPSYLCLDPDRHGHLRRYGRTTSTYSPAALPDAGDPGDDGSEAHHDRSSGRRLVIEGNKAWTAAGTVRQRWLAEFLARKAPSRDTAVVIARFVTTQLLTMPEPLCRALGSVRHHRLYQEFGGPGGDTAATASQPRLWMLALTPVAAAYEDQITGTGAERDTWRTDRYSPCPRDVAGAWLRFTAEIGHQLTPVEQAVADGLPYRGDSPAAADEPGEQPAGSSDPEPGSGEAGERSSMPEPDPGAPQAGDNDGPGHDPLDENDDGNAEISADIAGGASMAA